MANVKYFFLCGMRKIFALFIVSISLATVNSCKPDLSVPNPSSGNADMRKVIGVGDNYMSGYQDGALYKKGQQLSLPALITRQLSSTTTFAQPLLPDDNGIGINTNPHSNDYVTKSRLGYRTDCLGETGIAPFKSIVIPISAEGLLAQVSPAVNNFSAPFLSVKDYFNPVAGGTNGNVYYHRFASAAGTSTMYADAVAANATFFTAWIGMADIFEYARKGGVNSSIIPSMEFSIYLDSLLHGLTANGAKGVIATIPALESFPFYTLIPYDGLELDSDQAYTLNQTTSGIFNFVTGKNGFVIDCDICFPPFRKIREGEFILLNIPSDSLKCGQMGSFFGIPDVYILDSAEVDSVHRAIADFNSIITQKASQYNLALVDMNQYFKTVQSGIKWDGADFDSEFISGGFFSLDGYHPNQKGYALIANEFIKAINKKYGATIPPVNCSECDGILFP
jgi:hypothetical protein